MSVLLKVSDIIWVGFDEDDAYINLNAWNEDLSSCDLLLWPHSLWIYSIYNALRQELNDLPAPQNSYKYNHRIFRPNHGLKCVIYSHLFIGEGWIIVQKSENLNHWESLRHQSNVLTSQANPITELMSFILQSVPILLPQIPTTQ